MLTLWCAAVVFGTLLAVGVPFCWLLRGRRPLDEQGWLEVPFVGLAATVLVLQNLVYLDVPLRASLPVLVPLVLLAWVLLLTRPSFRACWRSCPWPVAAASLVVWGIAGLGLFVQGPEAYGGRYWSDQYNYVTLAEFFESFPFSTSLADIGNRPYLVRAVMLKTDRIGQSVLHGCFATLGGASGKAMFVPTILLGPALVVVAVYGLGRLLGFGRRLALIEGAFAGLLPALTMLHLECFQSQALCVPLLLYLPCLFARFEARRHPGTLAAAALVLAALTNIYSEFLPLGWLLAAGFLVVSWLGRGRSWKASLGYAAVLPAPLLLTPRYTPIVLETFLNSGRLAAPVLPHIFPWPRLHGLARLWFGDLVAGGGKWLIGAGVTLTALGLAGIVLLTAACLRSAHGKRTGEADATPAALPLSLLGLAAVPALLAWRMPDLCYQYYKLVLTVSPLLVLGLASLLRTARAVGGGGWAFRLRPLACAAFGLAFLCGAIVSVSMIVKAMQGRPPDRYVADRRAQTRTRQLGERLRRLRGCNVLCRGAEPFTNLWLTYLARHNRLWMAWPRYNDQLNLLQIGAAQGITDLEHLPDHLLILSPDGTNYLQPAADRGKVHVHWSSGGHTLWAPRTRDWICLTGVRTPESVAAGEEDPVGKWLPVSPAQETRLGILSGRAGTACLEVEVPGNRTLAPENRVVLFATPGGGAAAEPLGSARVLLRVPVKKGMNQVVVRAGVAPGGAGDAERRSLRLCSLSLAPE